MKELSKKELSQIVGGSLADWCAAVKRFIQIMRMLKT